MGTIKILPETTKNPITLMGKRAGVCWGADITDKDKNYKRGMDCIKSNHGRVMEFPRVDIVISGYSARTLREWYTHIGCLPSRLQSSTRYINYNDFNYVTPPSIKNNDEAWCLYAKAIRQIKESCSMLSELGIPKEDSAMLLPLGMSTEVVDSRNLRNYIDMSHNRECSRTYWEFRKMFKNICDELSAYSDEWKWIVNNEFMPKCELFGYCTEKKSCGRKPKKEV